MSKSKSKAERSRLTEASRAHVEQLESELSKTLDEFAAMAHRLGVEFAAGRLYAELRHFQRHRLSTLKLDTIVVVEA